MRTRTYIAYFSGCPASGPKPACYGLVRGTEPTLMVVPPCLGKQAVENEAPATLSTTEANRTAIGTREKGGGVRIKQYSSRACGSR